MKLSVVLLSIPKTIWINLRCLPFSQAVRLPIWVRYDTKMSLKGKILLSRSGFAMIRIGFHKVPICDARDTTVIDVSRSGELVFHGTAHIGHGTKIYVAPGACLEIGDNFAVSASSQINCYKKIRFGRDIQFSWDCLVMDSDTHEIFDENGYLMNEPREIVIGKHIWVGCRVTILKGSCIPDGCVVGACSLVSGKGFEKGSIIAGSPAKSIKKISNWKL